jgi:diacylglycerol kinase (ATP)
MKLRLLLNPSAGRGRAAKRVGAAVEELQRLGAEVSLGVASSAPHLAELAREASAGTWDRIVACGGDGTVHWVLRGLDRERAVLGVLGLGSGNDLSRVLKMPQSVAESCRMLLEGDVVPFDVATANGVPWLGVGALGFDSEVARYANDHVRHLRGSLAYLYAIFRVIGKFTPHEIRIEIDGESRTEHVMLLAVGNTHRYGGGIAIVPTAQPDDGMLDLCIVSRCSRWQLLRTLPKAYRGRHVESPFVRIERVERLAVTASETLELFADGEPVTTTPVELAIAPQKLRIVSGIRRSSEQ